MRADPARRAVVAAACAVIGVGVGSHAGASTSGQIAGLTQITYGCPGPQRVGQPCEHWFPFSHARFALTRDRADGGPISSTRRIVASDAAGRFTFTLTPGTYSITPLPQRHTHGGKPLTARVRAGATTRIQVRFVGYPMME
jgi:hypothetical protein